MQQHYGLYQHQQSTTGSIPSYNNTNNDRSSSYQTPPSTTSANPIPIHTTTIKCASSETTPPTTPRHSQTNSLNNNTAAPFSPLPSSTLSSTTTTRNNNMVVPTLPPVFDVINHPVKDTLLIVSCLLSKLVHKNDSCYNPLRDPITLFHSRAVPRISIEAYLTRILQYIPFTNEVLLNVLVFLDRIGGLEGMQMHQGSLLTPSNQSNALSSTPGPIAASSFVVPVGGSNCSRAEGPEISCNLASSFSASSSSAPLSSSNNSTTTTKTTCASTSTCSNNSDSSLPIIQKRGREAEDEEDEEETETTTSTEASFKKFKNESAASSNSSSMPSPPLVDVASPVAEQPVTTGNGFRINSFNIHRLLITSLMIAAKFTSDLFYSNARYAKVGGLALQELNQLELEFLFTSKFELNVKVDELQRAGNSLLQFRDRHMVPSPVLTTTTTTTTPPQQQSQTTMTMMIMQQQLQQQLQFQAQLQAQIQAAAAAQQVQAQALALKQQQQAGSLLSPPEEKRPWDETTVATPTSAQSDHQHSYYTHQV